MSQEWPLDYVQSAAASQELHLTPICSGGVSSAASGNETGENHDSETAEEAISAASVSITVDDPEGVEENTAQDISSEPALDAHSTISTTDEQSFHSALSPPG